MAGRKPRETLDGQRGTDPLNPRRGPAPGAPGSGNAVPGSHGGHKFGAGNTASVGNSSNFEHGMYSGQALKARAEAIVTAMLSDALCPAHLRMPAFAATVLDWGRAEAVASLAFEHLCSLLDEHGLQGAFGITPGMLKAPSEVWKAHSAYAEKLRSDLGITPAGYARVKRDLGLAAAAVEDQLAAAEAQGSQIVQRRLGLVRGGAQG